MIEATCDTCHETFVPHSEAPDDLIHGIREDGEECGGVGTVQGEWIYSPPGRPRRGVVTIIRVRFLEDDVYEGDIPREAYDAATETVYDDLTAREAAEILTREGMSFAATGTDWAADPDGSRITNYATGERVETTATLSGFHPRVFAAIVARVG